MLARFVGKSLGYREMDAVRSAGTSVTLRKFYDAHSWTPRAMDLQRRILSPDQSLESNIAHINAFRPNVIRGYASYIGAVFRRAHERKLALSPPEVVSYGAETLSPFDRQLIESEFGVRVISTYQAVEALRIAFQCELCQGFHISLDDVAVRVVDSDGKSLEPGGTGDIVISNLTNRATVLLNYKLRDVVTLSPSACACGRTLPTLQGIDGRSDDLVTLSDGHVTHSSVVLQGLRSIAGVVQIQLVQETLEHFSLRAVCAELVDWQRMRRDLDGALRELLGHDITLDLERVDAIAPEPGGKVRAVISRCAPQ